MNNIKNFSQTQIMFKVDDVGGAYFSGPGNVTYKIEPKDNGFHLEQKDSNSMRASPFGTFGKSIWSRIELKEFFEKQNFDAFNQCRAYHSKDDFIDITSKEDFILMFAED